MAVPLLAVLACSDRVEPGEPDAPIQDGGDRSDQTVDDLDACTDGCLCDGSCDAVELADSCTDDCPCDGPSCDVSVDFDVCTDGCDCGDGLCDEGEDHDSCPSDCLCGDGTCDGEENLASCPQDCHCGDAVCDPSAGEDACACAADCACGNGTCDPGETLWTCEVDCDTCGNRHCGGGEDADSCPDDCDTCPEGGNGICEPHEDAETCPEDCEACLNDRGGSDDPPLTLPNDGRASGSTSTYYSDDFDECGCCDVADVVYEFDSPGRLASLEVVLVGVGFDTALDIYLNDCRSESMFACNDDAFGSASALRLLDVPRGPIRIVVDGYDDEGDFELAVAGELAAGEPCEPSLTFLSCLGGDCLPNCQGVNVCQSRLDCEDSLDNDFDGLIDEDECVSPPIVTCPDDADALLLRRSELGATASSPEGTIVSRRWRVSSPASGWARPDPEDEDASSYTPDRLGETVLRFSAIDDRRQSTACEITLRAGFLDCEDGVDADADGAVDEDAATCVDPPVVTCPAELAATVGVPVRLSATFEAGYPDFEQRWSIIDRPDGSSALASSAWRTTEFVPDVSGPYRARYLGIDSDAEAGACEIEIIAAGLDCADGIDGDNDGEVDEDAGDCVDPPVVTCPDDADTTVLTPFAFDTGVAGAASPLASFWSAVSVPVGAPAGAIALPAWAGSNQWTFTPPLVGDYRVRYTVVDQAQQIGACELSLRSSVEADFRVELVWSLDHAEWNRMKVDLHLLHPAAARWADDLDCYAATCGLGSPDWGPGGTGDGSSANDPSLFNDQVIGPGTESVEIGEPEMSGPYGVGVHFVGDPTGHSAEVSLNIYCGGVFEQTLGPVALQAPNAPAWNDFWKAADVTFDPTGCEIAPIDEVVRQTNAQRFR